MDKTAGSVTTEKEDRTEEEYLFTYSEEEKQRIGRDREMAKRVYTPEFIPFYFDVQRKHDLTDKETVLYGFVRFYVKNSKEGRFYFSNEQLSSILGVGERQITRLVKGLKDKMGLPVKYKVKADGGTIRFINAKDMHSFTRTDTGGESELTQMSSPTRHRRLPNNNKINNNKTNNNKILNISEADENNPLKRIRKRMDNSKKGARYGWQEMAVRFARKLNVSYEGNNSWFKVFRDFPSQALNAALSKTIDAGAGDPEKYFYKVLQVEA